MSETVANIITGLSYIGAGYIVLMTIMIVIGTQMSVLKSKSNLWWGLVYSVIVVGMTLVALRVMPPMVLSAANDGIEAARPEMSRFVDNMQSIWSEAARDTGLNDAMNVTFSDGSTTVNSIPVPTETAVPPVPEVTAIPTATAVPAATVDPNMGGGGPGAAVTAVPTPTLNPILFPPTPEVKP